MGDTKVRKLVERNARGAQFFHSLETAYLGDVPEQGLRVSKEAFEGSAI